MAAGRTYRQVRVLLFIRNALYCRALSELLSKRVGMQVTDWNDACHGDFIDPILPPPDIVLLGVEVPDFFRIARRIHATTSAVKLIAIGVPEIDEVIHACAQVAVSGYVMADASPADLVATIEAVAQGERPYSKRIADAIFRYTAALAIKRDNIASSLTSRQVEVVEGIRDGLSNKQIARRLKIEVATVKNHVHNILDRLQVHHRTDVVALYERRTPGGTDQAYRFPLPATAAASDDWVRRSEEAALKRPLARRDSAHSFGE